MQAAGQVGLAQRVTALRQCVLGGWSKAAGFQPQRALGRKQREVGQVKGLLRVEARMQQAPQGLGGVVDDGRTPGAAQADVHLGWLVGA